MNILIIVKGWNSCQVAEELLIKKRIPYKKVEAMSADGIDLIFKYNVKLVPSLIDIKSNKAYTISELNYMAEIGEI